MAAGGGDFERALGAFLAFDVGEVERQALDLANFRLRPRQHLRAFEMIGELDERARRDDFDFGTGPGRFRAADFRADQALRTCIGADRRGQHAGHRRNGAVEPEFAQHGETGNRVGRQRADCRHEAERNRQIVMAAFLRQIGWGEIDGDAARRQCETRRDQRRAHTFFGFRHGLVGQADNVESGQARRNLHLNVNGTGVDTLEGDRCDPLDHGSALNPLPGSVT